MAHDFHRALLPTRTRIAEPLLEFIIQRKTLHGLCGVPDGGTALTTGADNDGNLHVVVHHGLRNPLYLCKEITVGLHQRQRVLTTEQPCAAPIGMQQSEHGHLHRLPAAAYDKRDFSPVELALLPGIMFAPDIDLLLRPGAHGRTDASDMIAHTRITEREAPLQKHRVDAATRPLKLTHACGATHTIIFKTLADNPLDFIRHYRTCPRRCVELRLRT